MWLPPASRAMSSFLSPKNVFADKIVLISPERVTDESQLTSLNAKCESAPVEHIVYGLISIAEHPHYCYDFVT